jgi:hypothetical protein
MILAICAACRGHLTDGSSTPASCAPLASVSASCPPDWTAALSDKPTFCARETPLFDAFLSTATCRGRLHYTRYLFDGGPRFCVYDPGTLELTGYAAFDGKARFEQTSCGTAKADFDDRGCAGDTCDRTRPDGG